MFLSNFILLSKCVISAAAMLVAGNTLANTCVSTAALAGQEKLCTKDLAIALPHTNEKLPFAKQSLASGKSLLPIEWYRELHRAYQQTSVGSSLMEESLYSDWQLVSMRVAPCAPLGKSPGHRIDEVCWPELRLVWQPILRKIILHARYMEASADDRAIHAIYPLAPEQFLPQAEAQRARTYLNKISQYLQGQAVAPKYYQPLSAQELQDFQSLRNSLLASFIADARRLRTRSVEANDQNYERHGLRPEFFASQTEISVFFKNLMTFLERYAQPEDLVQLTSFSLPEGREPAHLDQWVFLSFLQINGEFRQEKIPLHSFVDGKLIVAEQRHQRGTTSRDDDFFYEINFDTDDWAILQQSLILNIPDQSRLASTIADRRQRLVANTSCVSCHKLNDLRFDFHNFSYLEDREITISPRVVRDVELDLLWLEQKL